MSHHEFKSSTYEGIIGEVDELVKIKREELWDKYFKVSKGTNTEMLIRLESCTLIQISKYREECLEAALKQVIGKPRVEEGKGGE